MGDVKPVTSSKTHDMHRVTCGVCADLRARVQGVTGRVLEAGLPEGALEVLLMALLRLLTYTNTVQLPTELHISQQQPDRAKVSFATPINPDANPGVETPDTGRNQHC